MTLAESIKTIDFMSLFCINNGIVSDEPYKSVPDLIKREPDFVESVLPDGITMKDLKEYFGMKE